MARGGRRRRDSRLDRRVLPAPAESGRQRPAGDDLVKTYDTMISSGDLAFRNYLMFRTTPDLARHAWQATVPKPEEIEGSTSLMPGASRRRSSVPVICTGGFQTASFITAALERGDCDAVSIARPLIANNDLVEIFRRGQDRPIDPAPTATAAS